MPLEPLDKEGFLALWRRVLPESYTGPIEREGGGVGMDLPASQAAQWAEVERALNLSQQGYYLRRHSAQTELPAGLAKLATGNVLVHRAAPTQGVLVLPQGTPLLAVTTDSLGDRLVLGRYFSTAEVTLTETVGPFTVPVAAEFQGYTGNLEPNYITEFEALGRASVPSLVATATRLQRAAVVTQEDRFDPGIVGRYVRLVGALTSENALLPRKVVGTFTDGSGELGIEVDLALDAADLGASVTVEVEEYADLGLTVTQPAAITGGVPDGLGAIGTDRGRGRAEGESEENYRQRLAALADIISPASHIRILDRILGSAGIGYEYLEAGDVDSLMGFTWGVHPWGYGELGFQARGPGGELVGQGLVWPIRMRRFFMVLVDRSGLGEFGMPWGNLANPGYPPGFPNAWGLGIWGGYPVGFYSLIAQLWQELDAARAAGVAFLIGLR